MEPQNVGNLISTNLIGEKGGLFLGGGVWLFVYSINVQYIASRQEVNGSPNEFRKLMIETTHIPETIGDVLALCQKELYR